MHFILVGLYAYIRVYTCVCTYVHVYVYVYIHIFSLYRSSQLMHYLWCYPGTFSSFYNMIFQNYIVSSSVKVLPKLH